MSCTEQQLPRAGFAELEAFIDSLTLFDADDRQAALIEVLHRAQQIFGYLPAAVQEFVADRLSLPLGQVFGVISFYHYFTTEMRGQHQINFCMGTACFVRGAGKIIEKFEEHLGIKVGETTADGMISLGTLRCVGACSLAPVVMVDEHTYGNVTEEQVAEILSRYSENTTPALSKQGKTP